MTLSAKFATAISLVTLLAFAGLIPLGRWHDEYFTLYHFHESGFPYLGERLLRWSPRPLSELLAYTYSLAVYRFDSPLITEFLAIFWLMFVAAALWPVLHNDRAFLCASVLVALLLLGHPVAEVFYWPFATVAYLPTVAAALLLLTLDWGDQIEGLSGNAWIFFVLTIAAASSEVGALFSAIYVVLLLTTRSTEDGRGHLIFAFPLLLSGTVLYLQFTGRVATGGEVFGDPSVAHHPIATMSAVAKHLPFELLKGDSGHHAFTLLTSGLATKLLFFWRLHRHVRKKGMRPSNTETTTDSRRRSHCHGYADARCCTLQFWIYLLRTACHDPSGIRLHRRRFDSQLCSGTLAESQWPACRITSGMCPVDSIGGSYTETKN